MRPAASRSAAGRSVLRLTRQDRPLSSAPWPDSRRQPAVWPPPDSPVSSNGFGFFSVSSVTPPPAAPTPQPDLKLGFGPVASCSADSAGCLPPALPTPARATRRPASTPTRRGRAERRPVSGLKRNAPERLHRPGRLAVALSSPPTPRRHSRRCGCHPSARRSVWSWWTFTQTINPSPIITVSIAVPPWDTSGSGTPTTGINPSTMATLMNM